MIRLLPHDRARRARRGARPASAALIVLLGAACAPSEPPAASPSGPRLAEGRPCAEIPDVGWEAWGEGFFRTYCTACHSSANVDARAGAPAGVDFDTEGAVRARAADVRRVVLEAGTMPVGGGVHADDLVLLEVFLSCGSL